jgi:hypothetical protein
MEMMYKKVAMALTDIFLEGLMKTKSPHSNDSWSPTKISSLNIRNTNMIIMY